MGECANGEALHNFCGLQKTQTKKNRGLPGFFNNTE